MLHRLLAKMDENQARSYAARKADKEEMLAVTARMHDALKSGIKEIKFMREETMACQGTMEARLETEESASVEATPEVADDQEVPVEDTEVRSGAEPRKRRRKGRNLAAVRRQKKNDRVLDASCRGKEQGRAQRKNGHLKNLVAARRWTTSRAVMARRRILFTKTTRNRLFIAVRKVTRGVQVARRNILSTKDTTRKNLAATGRKETRRAKVTQHKGNFVGRNRRKKIATGGNHTKDKVERGTQRMWALERRF
jgi:hypothetical protein